MHRLTDKVFAQHGPERRATVPVARERSWARTLELYVAEYSIAGLQFA
jgi:hypothetical protein